MRLVVLTAFLAAALAPAAAAQHGAVTGRVINQITQQPLASAQVLIAGTASPSPSAAITDADGRYRIDSVPPGHAELRVRYIGFTVQVRIVAVRAGETTLADFALSQTAVGLDAITITASGEQRTRELPNAVTTVAAVDLAERALPTDMGDLLTARAPSLVVQQSGGTTGSGMRLRIRGSNSVSISNEPVVLIDGIRVNNAANAATVAVGGQQPSRLEDLNIEDIESIDVIRGPSAAALYGMAAANGVIQIRTRRGTPGRTAWKFYFESAQLSDHTEFPGNYRALSDTVINGFSASSICLLSNTSGVPAPCTQDRLLVANPLESQSPFQTGWRGQWGGSVSGGNEGLNYYVSGEFDDESGIYAVSDATRYHLRANLAAVVSPTASVTVSTGYTTNALRLPENDNNAFGIIPSGLLGRVDALNGGGYGFLTPAQSMSILTRQSIDRFTGSVDVDWRPLPWLEFQGVVGTDVTATLDEKTFFPGAIPAAISLTAYEGSRTANRIQRRNITATFLGKAHHAVSAAIRSTTTVAVQYFRDRNHSVFAFGRKLSAVNNTLGGTAIAAVDEGTDESILLGGFVEQLVGIRDRLFLSAALRADRTSAFGRNLQRFTASPKVGASWVVSDRGSLRLRAAYGEALLQPATTAAVQFYDGVAVTADNTDVPGFTFGNLGNPDLRPERTREIEVGFDADFLAGRGHAEVTYYAKRSRDALIARRIAPSAGVATTQFENLGEVSNRGVEIALGLTPVESDLLTWDVQVSAWGNRNRLIELGEGISPIVFGLGGASQRHAEGYPLGGYWFVPYTAADANGDGVIQLSEVHNGTAPRFFGTPYPSHGGALATSVLLRRRLRLFASFEGRFGHRLFNSTEEFRCGYQICRGLHDPTTSLTEQARAVASGLLNNDAGFVEDASFVKFRELSLTWFVPEHLAGLVGAQGLTLTLATRNLATWTRYSGFDPETSGGGQSNFNQWDFLSQAPLRYLTFRVNATY